MRVSIGIGIAVHPVKRMRWFQDEPYVSRDSTGSNMLTRSLVALKKAFDVIWFIRRAARSITKRQDGIEISAQRSKKHRLRKRCVPLSKVIRRSW